MRNIIFTSFLAALAAPALAQDGGPPFGCYARDYDAAHLAAHPDQVVDRITLRVYRDQHGQHVAGLQVLTANQGHVAMSGNGGQVFDQWLVCWEESGTQFCGVECDGGSFQVTRYTGEALTIELRSLWVGDVQGCGGAVDIGERPGQSVKYRLDVMPDSACEGI